jgi:hypothetical protein
VVTVHGAWKWNTAIRSNPDKEEHGNLNPTIRDNPVM